MNYYILFSRIAEILINREINKSESFIIPLTLVLSDFFRNYFISQDSRIGYLSINF